MVNKSKEEIEIDFSRAIMQAQELEEISKELGKIAGSNISEAMMLLGGSFQGDNAIGLRRKGGELSSDIYETADDLIKVARKIRSTADIVYKAEKAATMLSF